MSALKRAVELQPDNPRYGYVYGIALNSVGKGKVAIAVLEKNYQRHPHDRQTLFALVTVHRGQGDNASAVRKRNLGRAFCALIVNLIDI